MRRTAFTFFIFTFLGSAAALADPIGLVNRTGRVINMVQGAPLGQSRWGNNLLAAKTLPDGESTVVELFGDSPWTLRFLDAQGDSYILYDVSPSGETDLILSPEHRIHLPGIAGLKRGITLLNQTGFPIVSLRLSPVSDGRWGEDVLDGRSIVPGEDRDIEFRTDEGMLDFDIQFILMIDGGELSVEKNDVVLTDSALLVLSMDR